MSNADKIHVNAEDPGFSMVPYWVLFRASGNAVKLYAVLRKYANNETGMAHPSRSRLADDMEFKDPKSLTPLIKELEQIGALEVRRRRLEHSVNHYRVLHNQPARSVAPKPEPQPLVSVGEDSPLPNTAPIGEDSPLDRGEKPPLIGEKTPHELDPLTRPNELYGPEPLFEAPASTAIAVPHPADSIAKRAYDQTGGALPFMGMREIARHFISQGTQPANVERAMSSLWHAGRAVTKQTVGQTLQGIIKPGVSPFKSGAEKRLETTLRNAEMFAARDAQGSSK